MCRMHSRRRLGGGKLAPLYDPANKAVIISSTLLTILTLVVLLLHIPLFALICLYETILLPNLFLHTVAVLVNSRKTSLGNHFKGREVDGENKTNCLLIQGFQRIACN